MRRENIALYPASEPWRAVVVSEPMRCRANFLYGIVSVSMRLWPVCGLFAGYEAADILLPVSLALSVFNIGLVLHNARTHCFI